jgi:hypothetical protein
MFGLLRQRSVEYYCIIIRRDVKSRFHSCKPPCMYQQIYNVISNTLVASAASPSSISSMALYRPPLQGTEPYPTPHISPSYIRHLIVLLLQTVSPSHFPVYSSHTSLFLPLTLTPTSGPSLQLRLLPHRPNLQPLSVLLQHALIMVFPELLRCVFAHYSLQDLSPAGVFVYEAYHAITLALSL